MRLFNQHGQRDALLQELRALWQQGPGAMPAARLGIESYLQAKGRRATPKWAALLSEAAAISPGFASFVDHSRSATAPPWDDLPPELKEQIAALSGASAMLQLTRVSKAWNGALEDQTVWREAYPSSVLHRPLASPPDWRVLALEHAAIARRLQGPQGNRSFTPVETIVAWQAKPEAERLGADAMWSLIEALVVAGRTSEAASHVRDLGSRNLESVTQRLWKLAQQGHAELVEAALDAGAPPDTRDPVHGSTPLMWAAQEGRCAVTRLLLARGADVHARNLASDKIALDWALANPGVHLDVARELIAAGTPVDYRDKEHGSTSLMFAAQRGDVATVRFLLARGADVNAVNHRYERVPLDWALSCPGVHLGVVQELVAAGAPVNHRDVKWRSTPLMFAAQQGDLQAVRFLLDHGANVNATNQGKTALFYAVKQCRGRGPHLAVAEELRRAGGL